MKIRRFAFLFFLASILTISFSSASYSVVTVEASHTNSIISNSFLSDINNVYYINVSSPEAVKMYKRDGVAQWHLLRTIQDGALSIDFPVNNIGFTTGTLSGKSTPEILQTTNEAASFVGLKEVPFSAMGIQSGVTFYDKDFGYVYGTGINYVYRTTDEGASWTTIEVVPAGDEITCIDFTAKDTAYAISKKASIFKTTNSGNTWTELVYSKPKSIMYGGYVQAINANDIRVTTCSTDESNHYDATYLLSSSDSGVTWSSRLVTGETGLTPLVLSMHFENTNIGWLGGTLYTDRIGPLMLYRTLNGGVSWESVLPPQIPSDYLDPNRLGVFGKFAGIKGTPYFWAGSYLITTAKTQYVVGNAMPTVASISPATIEAGSNEVVTLTGSNFETTSAVFNVASALSSLSGDVDVVRTTVNSSTNITAEVAVNYGATAGAKTLRLTNPDLATAETTITVTSRVTPVPSFDVTSLSRADLFQGKNYPYIIVYGHGFDSRISFESSSSDITGCISFEGSTTEVFLRYIDVKSTAAAGPVTFTFYKGDLVTTEVVKIKTGSGPIEIALPVPTASNPGGVWDPGKGSLTMKMSGGIDESKPADIVVAMPMGIGIAPVKISNYSITNGTIVISPTNFKSGGPSSGVYPIRIYQDGKLVAKGKFAVKYN